MRVLLVEGDKETLATLAAALRYEKYEVMTAPDGRIALAMAAAQPPDVVVLDLELPDMDGYQLARELRKQAPQRPLFIAAITGQRTAADKKRAADAGIDAHLTKPAAAASIIELLKNRS